jgi:hypothetical protein
MGLLPLREADLELPHLNLPHRGSCISYMKRTRFALYLLLVLLPFGSNLYGQAGFRVGFRAQYQGVFLLNKDFYKKDSLRLYGPAPNAYGRDSFKLSYTPGFSLGGTFGYQFNQRHGVEVNFLYSWQGQKWEMKSTTGKYVREDRMHYIKIPLLYRFNTNFENPQVQFLLHIGLQVSVLARANLYIDNKMQADPDKTIGGLGLQNYFKEASLDGVVQIGVLFKPADKWEIPLQARVDASILDIEDRSYKLPTRGDTRYLTIGAFFGFNYLLIPGKPKVKTPETPAAAPAN